MSYDYVLDSYAWKEYFDGTKKGQRVAELLTRFRIATPVLVLAELSDVFERSHLNFEVPLRFIQSKSSIIPLHQEIAIKAGVFKVQKRKIISDFGLADAIIYMTAQYTGARLVTGDLHFSKSDDVHFLENK